jgi:hypothetical protein
MRARDGANFAGCGFGRDHAGRRTRRAWALLVLAAILALRASHLAIARGGPSNGSLDTVEGTSSQAVRLERCGLQYAVPAARVVAAP